MWSCFASFLATPCLTGSSFLEGGSGDLLVFHDLRSYVISTRESCRADFDTREAVDNSSKGNFLMVRV